MKNDNNVNREPPLPELSASVLLDNSKLLPQPKHVDRSKRDFSLTEINSSIGGKARVRLEQKPVSTWPKGDTTRLFFRRTTYFAVKWGILYGCTTVPRPSL